MTQYTEKDMTPFFPADVRPARIGVYETERGYEDNAGFQYWNGRHWCCWGFNIQEAERGLRDKSRFQRVKWRGLSFDPSKEAK